MLLAFYLLRMEKFIKDGKIFHEIYKGNKNLDQMYQCISDTLTLLATGGVHHE